MVSVCTGKTESTKCNNQEFASQKETTGKIPYLPS